mmetsp:Transcript_24714/g.54337  ORF Transcript_24714/g.54337 Transcript_24714/m.54337 type:complete len:171 (-) Transcript_24714:63-575(-)
MLRDSGVSAIMAAQGGCSLEEVLSVYPSSELRFMVSDSLDAPFCAKMFLRFHDEPAEAMREAGFSAKVLREGGYSVIRVLTAGFQPAELRGAGLSARDLRNAGLTTTILRNAGVSAAIMWGIGFGVDDLREAGFTTIASLRIALASACGGKFCRAVLLLALAVIWCAYGQ